MGCLLAEIGEDLSGNVGIPPFFLGRYPKKNLLAMTQQVFNTGQKCSWWRFTDSNRGPVDYDSIALTD